MADGSEQENSAEDEGDVEMGEMDASDSELEDDLHGRQSHSGESGSEEESMEGTKTGIYKAPKLTAVTYEDKKDKKRR